MAVVFEKNFNKELYVVCFCPVQEEIICNVLIRNDDQDILKNPKFIDTLIDSLSLVPGTFKVNNSVIEAPDLENGVSLSDIEPGDIVRITFNLKLESFVPTIKNQATLNYEIIDVGGNLQSVVINSNETKAEIAISV